MEVTAGYKYSEIGLIPDEWDAVELPRLIWFQEGPGLRKWQFKSSGLKVINVTNLQENGYLDLSKTDRHISWQEVESIYKHFLIDEGDIVIASSGNSYCKVAIVRFGDLPLLMNTSVIRFKAKDDLNKKYMHIFLKSSLFKDQIDLMITGGAQPNFGPYHLKKCVIPVPPTKAEQEAIAEALSDADAYIKSLEKLIAKKRLIKQGAMQELLTGKRRLPGFSGAWSNNSLSSLCQLKSGVGITSKDINPNEGFPCYGGNGLRGFAETYTHEGTYALIGRVGALCGNIQLAEGRFFASEHTLVVYVAHGIDVGWISLVLREMNLNQYAESSAQPVLTATKLGRLNVNYPSNPEEQHAIYKVIKSFDDEFVTLSYQLGKAKMIKQGMMQELLTGRIRLV